MRAADGVLAAPWLDPTKDHDWSNLPVDYTWHLEAYGWAVKKPEMTDADELDAAGGAAADANAWLGRERE